MSRMIHGVDEGYLNDPEHETAWRQYTRVDYPDPVTAYQQKLQALRTMRRIQREWFQATGRDHRGRPLGEALTRDHDFDDPEGGDAA